MSAFVEFVTGVLEEGSVLLSERPVIHEAEKAAAARVAVNAYATYRLQVAGPLLTFDREAALMAAECLWLACWYLVVRQEDAADLQRRLPEPPRPATAAQHLSADLFLRFLAQVHRRSRILAADDLLTAWLERWFRNWPLSGVLADVSEKPLEDPDFDGHRGLQLLYAERLAASPRPAWLPGRTGRDLVEFIFAERGLPMPAALVARGDM